jgi:uncharacterized protein (DUF1501 family)
VNPILANPNSTVAPLFANLKTSTANQLFQVAKMIEARAATAAKRQIFFVWLGSFDTHGDQSNRQQNLFAELSPALKAFYDATVALGVSAQVTTFTLSDFGRSFQPASGGGTDHAWGSHHFIIGDAVQGGAFYGEYPQLVLGGRSDAESEGRWLPSTAVDQDGATLAKWFGVAPADLETRSPTSTSSPPVISASWADDTLVHELDRWRRAATQCDNESEWRVGQTAQAMKVWRARQESNL